MIFLCGIPSEPPVRMIREALDELNFSYVLFNQRKFAQTSFYYEILDGQIAGSLTIEDQIYDLQSFSGIYMRLMDDQSLPELQAFSDSSPERVASRRLHDALFQWLEITNTRVVNRASAMGSNTSKPYQAQLITKYGFSVPDTLITNDPESAKEFRSKHEQVIYKSVSSVRSIVQKLGADDLRRIERICWCPTQFQEFIEGTDVRVHVVGNRIFATAIETEATDYRYAHKQNAEAELRAVDLDDATAAKCIRLTAGLGLDFAGIDLKITPSGEVFCFEVNPSPGFSYFEANTGQTIAKAVAEYLAKECD